MPHWAWLSLLVRGLYECSMLQDSTLESSVYFVGFMPLIFYLLTCLICLLMLKMETGFCWTTAVPGECLVCLVLVRAWITPLMVCVHLHCVSGLTYSSFIFLLSSLFSFGLDEPAISSSFCMFCYLTSFTQPFVLSKPVLKASVRHTHRLMRGE